MNLARTNLGLDFGKYFSKRAFINDVGNWEGKGSKIGQNCWQIVLKTADIKSRKKCQRHLWIVPKGISPSHGNFLMKLNTTDHSDSPRLLLPLFLLCFCTVLPGNYNQDLKSFCEHYILAPQFEKQALTVNKFNLEQNVAVRHKGRIPFHVCQNCL